MKGNEYNDLWVILNNLPEEARKAVPDRYMAFVKTSMVPDAGSEVNTEKPIEEQTLSGELRGLLACLTLTYWAKDPADRREFAETLNSNELSYQGKPDARLTDEGYQQFLGVFDDWNDMFGPIPFWAESRGWEPWQCYEIVPEEEAEIMAGKTGLREVYVTKEQREQILKEAGEWVIEAVTKSEETLYWHDDDHSEWTSTREIEDFCKKSAVVRDGHFIGALLEPQLTSSMGLSVYRDKQYGILLTDGTSDGRTGEYFSHSSDEVSESEDTTFSLKRKTSEQTL